ncbi:MAG: acyl-CoA dehydrogenase family protein, partial [Sphingomonadales bacterium]|nr:acyl-CoA dehydrogenase family protein [Sphingomonadales bacterium]
MSDYSAPTKDMRFVLTHIAGLEELASFEAYQEATPDLVDAVLEEAGKLARDVIAPLNTVGDTQGSVLADGTVKTPDGFKEAYRQYVEGGWNGLAFDPGFGGQGLPFVLGLAVQEAITSANMSFSLCPMLNVGAVEAVTAHGSDALKATYLEKMIAGEWTGTMNLTEPQAGSDVG